MVQFETVVDGNTLCLSYNGDAIPLVEVADFLSLFALRLLPRVPHRQPNGFSLDDFFVLEIAVPVLATVLEALLQEDDDPGFFTAALPDNVRKRIVEIARIVFELLVEQTEDGDSRSLNELVVKTKAAARMANVLWQALAHSLLAYTNVDVLASKEGRDEASAAVLGWFVDISNVETVSSFCSCLASVLGCLGCPAIEDCYDTSRWQSVASEEFWDAALALLNCAKHMSYSDACVELFTQDLAFQKVLQRVYQLFWIPVSASQSLLDVKLAAVSLMVPLCENEHPYFLDFFSGTVQDSNNANLSTLVAKRIMSLARAISPQGGDGPDAKVPTEFEKQLSREAFRVLELLSYDSGFISTVVEGATENLLSYLSMHPETFVDLFNVHQSFEEDVTVLVFRLIANLHCYNPAVSLVTHKDLFVNSIVHRCHAMYSTSCVPNQSTPLQLVKEKNLSAVNVATNLFTLFAKVTESYSYSQIELELWQDFMSKMNSRLHFNFPKIVSGPPSPEAPPLSSLLGPRPGSERALAGCNFLFIDFVGDDELRSMVLQHGGAIYEYVAKSVTHLVRGTEEPTRKSLAKVKAAHEKRIPIVPVNFIYDSISNGSPVAVTDYME